MLKLLMAAALVAACQPAAASPARPLELVDLTDDYARIWSETQKLPEAERPAYFKAAFAPLIPGFYDPARLSRFGVTAEQYDEFVGKMLASYPKRRDAVARTSADFGMLFHPALASFEAQFGPMRGYPPIYLVDSHNEFDGATRELTGGTRLLFGADVIGRTYQGRPIQPFFHHELFHLMHSRTFPECEQVWCALWFEGLAIHVAAKLNPAADDEALLLNSPSPLRTVVENNRTEAVCAVVARLDSEKAEDYGPLFTGGGKPLHAKLPRRFGYYVGLLVAQDLGRDRSLQQLAALDHQQVRPLLNASLARMASCPPAGERG